MGSIFEYVEWVRLVQWVAQAVDDGSHFNSDKAIERVTAGNAVDTDRRDWQAKVTDETFLQSWQMKHSGRADRRNFHAELAGETFL